MQVTLKDNTYVIGDTHGGISRLDSLVRKKKLGENTDIVMLGDCGLCCEKWPKHYLVLNDNLQKSGYTLYIFRGNHDNPDFFKSVNDLSNIKILEDGTILKVKEMTGIVMGGGLSIDRSLRWKENYPWYKDELFNESHLTEISELDFILSHTGIRPKAFEGGNATINYYTLLGDPNLEADLQHEQDVYKKFLVEHNIKYAVYGHYHVNDIFEWQNTKCFIVDIDTIISLDHFIK